MSASGAKDSPHGEAARRLVLAGIKPIGDLMKASLGPRGHDAVIDMGFGAREVTRAAPAAAKEILLRQGNQLMHEVIAATSGAAGDGTATAAVLAQAIFSEASELVAQGHDALEIRRGIERAVEAVGAHVTRSARPVTGAQDVARVASASARSERRLGEVVARALELAGRYGVFVVDDDAGEPEATVEAAAGVRFESGYLSRRFVTDRASMTCALDDCRVFLFDGPLTTRHNLLPLLDPLSRRREPILLIAADVSPATLDDLEAHVVGDWLRCAAVRAPASGDGDGDGRRLLFEDIAFATGGRVVRNLAAAGPADLGRAKRVLVDERTTTILGAAASEEALAARQEALRGAAGRAEGDGERDRLLARLALLSGGLLVIKPGLLGEVGPQERRALVGSAIRSSRAALDEGFVAGGGVALLRAQAALDRLDPGGDQGLGVQVVRRALEEPLRQIATNAGADGARVTVEVQRGEGLFGYDAISGRCGDLLALGILDAAKIVRSALEHAAAAAGALLSSEAWLLAPRHPSKRRRAEALKEGAAGAAPSPHGSAPVFTFDGESVAVSPYPVAGLPRPDARAAAAAAAAAAPDDLDGEPPPTIRRPRPSGAVADGALRRDREESEATGVMRYPSIRRDSEVRAGAPLVLNIDLRRRMERGAGAEPGRVKGLPAGWTAIPIQVHVTATGVLFAPACNQGVIVIRRDRDSTPCALVGTVAPGAAEIEIIATFFYNGRYCGESRRSFPVVGSGAAAGAPESGLLQQPYPGRVVLIEPWVAAPDMTVRVFHRRHDPPGLFGWHIALPSPERVRGMPAERTGEARVDDDPEGWALKLLDGASDVDDVDDLDDVDEARLAGVGDALYGATPACFREAYRALLAHHGGGFSIQLICDDDPFIPWELMRPVGGDGVALPLLLVGHPVGRWVPGRPRRAAIDREEGMTVVPKPARRAPGALPAAEPTPDGPGALGVERESSGYLTPLLRAREAEVADFADGFIERVFRRCMPVGEALCELRKASSPAAALAYLYYGDVMARFEGPPLDAG